MIFIVVQLPEFNIIVWPIDKIFTRQNFVSPSVYIFLSLFLSLYVWHSLSLSFPHSRSCLSIYLSIQHRCIPVAEPDPDDLLLHVEAIPDGLDLL